MSESNDARPSGEVERPRRDVSARTAIGSCDYCGGNANSTLGGEHIFKCSEIVPTARLEELADEWERQRTGNAETDKAFERAAERLREVAHIE